MGHTRAARLRLHISGVAWLTADTRSRLLQHNTHVGDGVEHYGLGLKK